MIFVENTVDEIRKAILNPGPNPTYHLHLCDRVRRQWPTLWEALMKLLSPAEYESLHEQLDTIKQ